jgi:hypothetical protein
MKITISAIIHWHTNRTLPRLGGWKLNVAKTIFEDADPGNVINGWKLLSDLIPMDFFSLLFFTRTAYENLKLGLTYEKGYETDLVELLRLCHWFHVCTSLDDINLNFKKSELVQQLGGELLAKGRSYLTNGQIQNIHEMVAELPTIISTKLTKDVYNMTNQFREKVSSYVSEFMISALAAKYNLRVQFKQVIEGEYNYDMLINEIPCEVETILDRIPWAERPEAEVKKEILWSLRRQKMRDKITDGVKQGGKIILVNSTATVSSLSRGINIDASQIGVIYTLKRALKFAINHLTVDSISVVVFGTAIDYERNYRLSAFYISYPCDDLNSADPPKLSLDDVYF